MTNLEKCYVEEFKNEFRKNHGYIYYEDYFTDQEISEWLNNYEKESLDNQIEYFADYCMSRGMCEVVE